MPRRRNGVRKAGGAASRGALRPLLPDARLGPGRRGRRPGVSARGLAGPRQLRGPELAAGLALPRDNQRLPAARLAATPPDAVVRLRPGPVRHPRSWRAGDRSGLARAVARRSPPGRRADPAAAYLRPESVD